MSRQSAEPSDEFTLLMDKFRRADPSIRLWVDCQRAPGGFSLLRRTLMHAWQLAAARAVIIDSYIIAVSVLPLPKDLPVIQTWHAHGAIKKFGWASLGTVEGSSQLVAGQMRMHENYTLVTAGGPGAVADFAAGFQPSASAVQATGQVTHDLLTDPEYVKLQRQRIDALQRKHNLRARFIVYAPTLRRGRQVEAEGFLTALVNEYGETHTVVLCSHPLDGLTKSKNPAVFSTTQVPTRAWLTAADHVITDYSAIAFEAVTLGTPTWFYPFDIDEYRQSPGLFLDPAAQLPAITGLDAAQLINRMRAFDLGKHALQDAEDSAITDSQRAWEWLRAQYCTPAEPEVQVSSGIVQLCLNARPNAA